MNRTVQPIVRLLLAWLLLLVLPLQGYAAARMPLCAGGTPAGAIHRTHDARPMAMTHGAPGHDHAAMLRAQAAAQDDAGGHGAHQAAGEHGSTKAGSCASCCIGAVLAHALPLPPQPEPPDSQPIPFRAGHLPSVDPVLPDRPPRHALA